jgi:hypothetical protein
VTLLRADDLVPEALEEELSTAARAQGLIGLVPDRGLAATGGVCGPKLRQRRTTRAGRDNDLTQSMPTEIAIKLSANSHVDLQGNTSKNDAGVFLVPMYPKNAVRVPLNKARPRAAKPRGADDVRRGRCLLAEF